MIHFGLLSQTDRARSAKAFSTDQTLAYVTKAMRYPKDTFSRVTFGMAEAQLEADPYAYGQWLNAQYNQRKAESGKAAAIQWVKAELAEWLENRFKNPAELNALALVDLVRLYDGKRIGQTKLTQYPQVSEGDENELYEKATAGVLTARKHEDFALGLGERYDDIKRLNQLIKVLLDTNHTLLGALRLALNDFIGQYQDKFTKESLAAVLPEASQ